MKRIMRICALLFTNALCLTALGAGQHASLPSATVPDGLGANIHFNTPGAGEMEMLTAAGFRWVRTDFVWGDTEKVAGQYDFAAYDRLLATLEQHKVRTIFVLDYGNKLYGADGAVRNDEGRNAFARWAATAVTHFKGHGILWEIWNEPNGDFWKPKSSVDEYAALALATSKAIRAAAPDEAIVGPATSEVDMRFLEGCFKAGLLDYWDAVTVHPYRQSEPESAEGEYRRLRKLVAQYAPKDKVIPILSGEWGYSSGWQNGNGGIYKQGKMLSRQWLTNLANGIPLSIWYEWHDDSKYAYDPEHRFGTVEFDDHTGRDPVFYLKPAYHAAKTLTTVLSGFTFEKRIGFGCAPDDYVLLFRKGEEIRLAVWNSAGHAHTISLDCDNDCTFDVVSHTGEKLEPIVSGNQQITIKSSDGPQFVIPRSDPGRLARLPPTFPYRVTFIPLPTKVFLVRIDNYSEAAWNGSLQLKYYGGLPVDLKEQAFEFVAGESEKTLSFALATPPESSFRVGAYVKSPGVTFERPVGSFNAYPANLLSECKVVADGDPKANSEFSVMMAPPPEPLPGANAAFEALKINYFFGDGWKFLQFELPTGTETYLNSPRAIGMWIYGDGKGAVPRVRVTDARTQTQTWQPSGQAIDWKGWRYVVLPFDNLPSPVRWKTPFILDNPSKKKNEGIIYIAMPMVIY